MALLIGTLGALLAISLLAWWRARRERTARERLDARLRAIERDRSRILRRRDIERDLEQALEHARTEDEVVELVRHALVTIDPDRPFELHLVDAHEPVMRLAFATGVTDEVACDISSPWASIAAREGTTLVYRSTDVDDVCPHLLARVVEPCSAVAVPLLATGRIVGVLYAMGPDGEEPPSDVVETYEAIGRAAAAHLAAVRGFSVVDEAPGDRNDDGDIDLDLDLDITDAVLIDEYAALGGRDEASAAISQLIAARAPFALLVFDIDGFGVYHAQHGAATAEAALRTVHDIAVRALVDTEHLVFRLDGDRFLALLDRATAREALRRAGHIRDTLARDLSRRREPPFTVSFGVVEASPNTSTERVLFAVMDALYNARAQGSDRAVLGIDTVLGNA